MSGLLTLSLMSKIFSRRPSEIYGIADDAIAFDFDSAAAWALEIWNNKKEADKLAIMGAVQQPVVPMVEMMHNGAN